MSSCAAVVRAAVTAGLRSSGTVIFAFAQLVDGTFARTFRHRTRQAGQRMVRFGEELDGVDNHVTVGAGIRDENKPLVAGFKAERANELKRRAGRRLGMLIERDGLLAVGALDGDRHV